MLLYPLVAESLIVNQLRLIIFDYIDPIYNGLKRIESTFSNSKTILVVPSLTTIHQISAAAVRPQVNTCVPTLLASAVTGSVLLSQVRINQRMITPMMVTLTMNHDVSARRKRMKISYILWMIRHVKTTYGMTLSLHT
jgi:hypothetical protein